MGIETMLSHGIGWCKAHSPQLLTGGATIGVILTGVLSYRAGLKSERILNEKRKEFKYIDPDDREAKRSILFETVKDITPYVLPAVVVGGLTIVCCNKAQAINASRIATLSSIVGMATKELTDVHEEMVETFGEKKAKQVRDKAMQRRFNKEHPNDGEECRYLFDCGGDILCCDIYGDIYFTSTHEKVRQAIENLSYQCADEGNVTLNDLYLKLGIPTKDWANSVVWSYRDLKYETNNFGVPIPKLPIETTTILGFNDKPCLGIRYDCDSVCY